jgi:16S rRNA C967 or C1407 C5-methylase (RsmB/RsmF family)
MGQEPPVSVRINPLKPATITGDPVPWCAHGRYLAERPVFTLDPLFHAGCYYVQEASSMLLEQAVKSTGLLDHPILAADLCAAPGGKSTHLLSLLHPGSLLVANEAMPARRGALIENLWKWGAPNVRITGNDASAFAALGPMFDLIVVDAPCSGEGMFRKDPFAREQWNAELVQRCARTQHDITAQAWQALKPGGALIYSTCTWEHVENEARIEQLVAEEGADPIDMIMSTVWGVVPSGSGWRCYPHRVTGEGFFIAAVRKPGTLVPSDPVHASLPSSLYAIDSEERGWDHRVKQALLAGAAHEGPIELDGDQALAYLRGEVLRSIHALGLRTVTHQGHALGVVKGVGDRLNNLHPKPWRIRLR